MKQLSAIGFVMMALFQSGCTKTENVVGNEQITGSGKLVSQTRDVGTFSGIQVTNFAKVLITQDTVESLRIESDDNVIDLVSTSVSNGILIIGLRDGSYRNAKVNVYVSMRIIRLLESTGTAEFSTMNSIQTDSLVCRIRGTGIITMTGSTTTERVEIIGSGSVNNFGLTSSLCYASISGVGKVEVNVAQRLDATITGTGMISYAGNPAVVNQSVTGIGNVRPR
jgi:hypothetical protein